MNRPIIQQNEIINVFYLSLSLSSNNFRQKLERCLNERKENPIYNTQNPIRTVPLFTPYDLQYRWYIPSHIANDQFASKRWKHYSSFYYCWKLVSVDCLQISYSAPFNGMLENFISTTNVVNGYQQCIEQTIKSFDTKHFSSVE